MTSPSLRGEETGVLKVRNFQALYQFEGYVVEEFICQEVGAQINLRFDARIGPRCPHCQSKLPRNKTGKCAVMDLPIADGPVVYICFPTVQGHCKKCLHFVTTRPKEIHPTRSATWRLMRMISAWAAHAPATQIAAIYEISDSTVRLYDKEVLKTDLPPPNLDHLRTLLVDEKAVRRGHNYVTIVLNGDTGELLYMAEGKKREVLDRFFEQLNPEQKSSIEAVGIDRSGAYQSSIEAHLPGAAIVYDRFHLMMNLNQAVDQVRREQWREASEQDRSVIKGSRFLLLAHAENLSDTGEQRLHELLRANEELSMAYQLKEQFKGIFQYQKQGWALRALDQWCAMAQASDLSPFQRLAKGLMKQRERVCGFVKHRLTSGKIEGFNNLLSRIIHRACGIKDLDYLELKLRHGSVMRS